MKQKDIALIIIMVFIGGVAAFLISQWLFSSPQSRKQTAEVVDLINPVLPKPSTKYFNSNSVNPAVHIPVGGQNQTGQ